MNDITEADRIQPLPGAPGSFWVTYRNGQTDIIDATSPCVRTALWIARRFGVRMASLDAGSQ